MHLLTLLSLSAFAAAATDTALPIVDLGYVLQRATHYNRSGDYYSFSNIRFARAPTGNLRFRAPQPPIKNRTVQDGKQTRICYQAYPYWFLDVEKMLPQLLAGHVNSKYVNASLHTPKISPSQVPKPMHGETEDCLFLDVAVPRATFQARKSQKSPVLVWIYGGGNAFGYKTAGYPPSGLLQQAQLQTGKDIVFVAMNYRVGTFGWSGGSVVESDGDSNAGMLDQRFALDWVKNNIHLFGGDHEQVTVMGESGGALGVLGHLVSHGGSGTLPFQQAILQSTPNLFYGSEYGNKALKSLLKVANETSLDGLRKLSPQKMREFNYVQIFSSMWGDFPNVAITSGSYLPDKPIKLIQAGRYHKNIPIINAHNSNEGVLFVPPYAQTNHGYKRYINKFQNFLKKSPSKIEAEYPPPGENEPYPNSIERASLTWGDKIFNCVSPLLNFAYPDKAWDYIFGFGPGYHTEDLTFTFYNGVAEPTDPVGITSVTLQRWITSFAVTGKPAAVGTPTFPLYKKNDTVLFLNVTASPIPDPVSMQQCHFWYPNVL